MNLLNVYSTVSLRSNDILTVEYSTIVTWGSNIPTATDTAVSVYCTCSILTTADVGHRQLDQSAYKFGKIEFIPEFSRPYNQPFPDKYKVKTLCNNSP